MALGQIVGIMTDQAMSGDVPRWDLGELLEVEARLGIIDGLPFVPGDAVTATLGLDDASLLLDGMAFTEIASADLPWIDMVRWTSDFVTAELRGYWSTQEWLEFTAGQQ